MPSTWLQHRSALALALFIPWLPAPPSPPAAAVEGGTADKPQIAVTTSQEPLVLPGLVIEEISEGSALEKAGLLVGDVILSWERLPNPPANPEAAEGELTSYFDWWGFEVEQVPRGAVVLRGRRGGEPLELRVEPGNWEIKVRPVLSRALEEIYLAGKAQFARNPETAVRAWRSLAEGSRVKGHGDLRAWVALRIGDAWGEKAEWQKAEQAYREAVEAVHNLSTQVEAWVACGQAHERRNEYEAAEKAYTTALKIGQKLNPESLGVANNLTHLGLVAWSQGLLDLALDYFLQGLQLRERLAPESLEVAESLNNLGAVAFANGNLIHAHDYFLRTFQIRKRLAPQSLQLATSLNNLGVVARESGDLEGAETYLVQALQLLENLALQSLETASSLDNLGGLSLDRGDLDVAQAYYVRALHIQERLAPDSIEVAKTLNNLGVVNQERGDLDRALEYHLRSLGIQEQLAPQSLGVATSLSNLGALAQDQGDLHLARRYFLRALSIEEKLAPESLTVASSLSNLGAAAHASGELEIAYNYYLRSLRIEERLAPQSLSMAVSLNLLGNLDLARGKFARAQDYTLRALAIREKLAPGSRVVAYSLMSAGDGARALGELERAHSYYLRALEALENQVSKLGGSYHVQADFRTQHRGHYHDAVEFILVQGRFPEAFHVLERFRAQTFLTMLAERDTAFTVDIPEELDRDRRQLGALYDRSFKRLAGLNLRDHAQQIEAIRRELQKLDSEAGDVEARIRQASPRLAALQYPRPLAAPEVRQALDSGTLLLSYSVGKEKTALFAISRSGELEVRIIPLGEEALRSQVKQLLSLISEAVQGSSLGALRQQRLQTASRELYTALLGPVAERIAASERLLIVPDGPLHKLPFGALVRDVGTDATEDSAQYLAEWKPLHIALSATVFAELKQRRHSASENFFQAPIQIAAFGDPIYPQSLTKARGDSTNALPTAVQVTAQIDLPLGDPIVHSAAERGVFDWSPLPYTRREVEGIARLFPPGTARTFLGSEALEDRVKSLNPKTRILHLAAHGYTDEHLPSSSFVALTIPEDTSAETGGPERDNGLLQVWEIFERVRLDADLVVLSACDTGLGEEQGGEGLIGLTRAFQYAGARTVMASLWSVQDRATSELMIRFYKNLRAGLPKDEALRQAQIELIRGPIEVVNEKGEKTLLDASAPYFWAGFQVYGDWQ